MTNPKEALAIFQQLGHNLLLDLQYIFKVFPHSGLKSTWIVFFTSGQ